MQLDSVQQVRDSLNVWLSYINSFQLQHASER